MKGRERRVNGRGTFILSLHDNYDESKSHHENERYHCDVLSCDFFEMCDDVTDFYHMAIEFYNVNPVLGLRVCDKGECDNLGSIGDVKK